MTKSVTGVLYNKKIKDFQNLGVISIRKACHFK